MKSTKLTAIAAAIITTAGFINTVQAEISTNVGVVSQYYFRGIAQTTSASASAGIDYEKGGFYAGSWAADVSDGVEIDFYAGYGAESEAGLGWSLGFTSYQYTGDFDSAYNEINVGFSYGMFSASYNAGVHEDDEELGITESDYGFLSLTVENNGYYATYGTWGQDFDGNYLELGYGTEIGGFDAGVALIVNSKELDTESAQQDGDETLIFSISKSF